MFATSQDRAASRNTKFVCVGCRTNHLDQLESKNILVLKGIGLLSFREDYSAFPDGNNLTKREEYFGDNFWEEKASSIWE